MFVETENYRVLSVEEAQEIEGGSLAIIEAGVLIVGAAYGAGYAIGEFLYNVTH